MENGFQKEGMSSEDELVSEVVEFEEVEKMEEFEIGKFKKLMYKLKNRKEPISTLTALRTIKIPPSFVRSERLIHRTQSFLHHKESWFPAMLLIRKLEQKNGNSAPKLKESIEMKEMWKEARIRKMKNEQWMKDFEKKFPVEKEQEERKRRDRNHSYSNPANHHRNRNRKKKNKKKKKKPNDKKRHNRRTVESYSNGLFGAFGIK